jgi:hypothetical protein
VVLTEGEGGVVVDIPSVPPAFDDGRYKVLDNAGAASSPPLSQCGGLVSELPKETVPSTLGESPSSRALLNSGGRETASGDPSCFSRFTRNVGVPWPPLCTPELKSLYPGQDKSLLYCVGLLELSCRSLITSNDLPQRGHSNSLCRSNYVSCVPLPDNSSMTNIRAL